MHPISAQDLSARFPTPTVSLRIGEAQIPVSQGVAREPVVPLRRRHLLSRRSASRNRVTHLCSNMCTPRSASITLPCRIPKGNRKRYSTIITIIHTITTINLVIDASMSLRAPRLASRSTVPFSTIFIRVFA